MPCRSPTLLVHSTALTLDLSSETAFGCVGSLPPVAPGRLRSACVLTSQMPRMKLRWQEYWIGSFQLVIIGNPSSMVLRSASLTPANEDHSVTLPRFRKYRKVA